MCEAIKTRTPLVNWERRLVTRLRQVFGHHEICRGHYRDTSWSGPSIEAPLFWIETAYGCDANLQATLERAQQRCNLERWPLAICQKPSKKALVAISLDDFLELARLFWTKPVQDLEEEECP